MDFSQLIFVVAMFFLARLVIASRIAYRQRMALLPIVYDAGLPRDEMRARIADYHAHTFEQHMVHVMFWRDPSKLFTHPALIKIVQETT